MNRDVVYMLRDGGGHLDYEELRFSLRSLQNLPHGRVWVFGGRPPWLSDSRVQHFHVPQGRIKHNNTGLVMTAIAHQSEHLSEEFYLFHDDFFITEPIPEVPHLYRSSWKDWMPSQNYSRAQRTQRLLKEFGKPVDLCYELHLPMVINSHAYREMVTQIEVTYGAGANMLGQVQKRSLYGNWVGYGGERHADPKIRIRDRDAIVYPKPYLSTSDTAFSNYRVGGYLREMFPAPSPYEMPGSKPVNIPYGPTPMSRRWYPQRPGHDPR